MTVAPAPVPPNLARFLARDDFDVAVVGAGPAGAAAAIEAAELKLRVAIVDEQALAGGQVYRAVPGIAPARPDAERTEGDRVRAQLGAANVERLLAHRVAHVERRDDAWHVHTQGPDGPRTVEARTLVLATGAQERHLPFTGWDRPGVLGLAAATVLLKAQRVLPGRNVVVAGAGPLLLLVAKAILDGGGRVAAVIDAHPRTAWFASAAEILSRPDLATRGMGWYRALLAKGVPLHHGALLRAVDGDAPHLRATMVPVNRDGHPLPDAPMTTFACDAVCVGYGLMPATELTRLLGAAHAFDPALGGWHVVVDHDQRSTVPRLYVAGDAAGITGAAAAPWTGRVAAMAAAHDLGELDTAEHAARAAPARREALRAIRFGGVMTRIANVGDGAVAAVPPDVVVCPCEGVTRATLEAAIAAGAATPDDLAATTRCGAGSCGGRVCGEAAARLIALRTGKPRAAIGQPTARLLRPMDLDTRAGERDDDARPIPAPAPR
ncbi:MAG: FAD-dependent oxidoreductase [Burkholderiales bacterium]